MSTTYDICNLGDGMIWAERAELMGTSTVDPSKVPLECFIMYLMHKGGNPFVFSLASSKSNIYLDLYDEFMVRFSDRTIRCHYPESSSSLETDFLAIEGMSILSYFSPTLMSKVRYQIIVSTRNPEDNLNEACKNLQFLDAHIQKYYNKVVTLHDAMESMIGSSATLDDWVNERGYQITSATINESTAQSVSHPLDASDIDSGIVDDSTKNNYSSSYDAKSSSRDSNLISQFKALWNNWVDVKNQILDDCEPWFVNVFSAW